MKISGKCKLANKFIDNKLDRGAWDFENKGNFAVGRITWVDKKKGKNGASDTFTHSTKKFICFEENIAFIEKTAGQFIEIEGKLTTESFTGKDGKEIKYDSITINSAKPYTQLIDGHNQAKGNGYAPEEEESSDEIPF